MTTSSPKDEMSSYNLLVLSPTIFMVTSKGDGSKDIMSNDCKVVINVIIGPLGNKLYDGPLMMGGHQMIYSTEDQ